MMKTKIRALIIFFALILPITLNAAIVIEVFISYKRGMDKGLILESEYQEIISFYGHEMNKVQLVDGIELNIQAIFLDPSSQIGPNDIILLQGKLLNANGRVLKNFTKPGLKIPIEGKESVVYKDESGILIDVLFVAKVR